MLVYTLPQDDSTYKIQESKLSPECLSAVSIRSSISPLPSPKKRPLSLRMSLNNLSSKRRSLAKSIQMIFHSVTMEEDHEEPQLRLDRLVFDLEALLQCSDVRPLLHAFLKRTSNEECYSFIESVRHFRNAASLSDQLTLAEHIVRLYVDEATAPIPINVDGNRRTKCIRTVQKYKHLLACVEMDQSRRRMSANLNQVFDAAYASVCRDVSLGLLPAFVASREFRDWAQRQPRSFILSMAHEMRSEFGSDTSASFIREVSLEQLLKTATQACSTQISRDDFMFLVRADIDDSNTWELIQREKDWSAFDSKKKYAAFGDKTNARRLFKLTGALSYPVETVLECLLAMDNHIKIHPSMKSIKTAADQGQQKMLSMFVESDKYASCLLRLQHKFPRRLVGTSRTYTVAASVIHDVPNDRYMLLWRTSQGTGQIVEGWMLHRVIDSSGHCPCTLFSYVRWIDQSRKHLGSKNRDGNHIFNSLTTLCQQATLRARSPSDRKQSIAGLPQLPGPIVRMSAVPTIPAGFLQLLDILNVNERLNYLRQQRIPITRSEAVAKTILQSHHPTFYGYQPKIDTSFLHKH